MIISSKTADWLMQAIEDVLEACPIDRPEQDELEAIYQGLKTAELFLEIEDV